VIHVTYRTVDTAFIELILLKIDAFMSKVFYNTYNNINDVDNGLFAG